jgi:hypothetical protein
MSSPSQKRRKGTFKSLSPKKESARFLFTVIDAFDRTMLASDLFGRCRTREALAVC